MANFGELISIKRKELGWTQKELAEKLSISPQYLNDLERNRRDAPSDQLIVAFADVLELDKDLLFYSAGEISPELREHKDLEVVQQAIAAFRKTLEDQGGK